MPASSAGVLGKLRRRRRRDQFVKVPMEWMHRLESARLTATYRVALHLLHEGFKAHGHGNRIRLANGAMALKGVTRWQKWRAIDELEVLGLIRVKHRPRKSPEITLLYPEDGD
jgi:hypothetical protein